MKKQVLVIVSSKPGSAIEQRAIGLFGSTQSSFDVTIIKRRSSRGRDFVRFLFEIYNTKPNLIYLLDTSIAGAYAVIFARMIRNIPLIVDTGDFAYLLARKLKRPGSIGRAAILIAEKISMRWAEAIVVRGSLHREMLSQRLQQKTSLIRDATYINRYESKFQNNCDTNLKICMIGTINYDSQRQTCYGHDLITALSYLKNLRISAYIVGDGDGFDFLRLECKRLGVENKTHFLGRIAYDNLPNFLAGMDVCISTQSNDPIGNARTTGKLVEYVAAGKFILASDVGEAKIILPEIMRIPYNGSYDPEYPKALAGRISEILMLGQAERVSAGLEVKQKWAHLLDYSCAAMAANNLIERCLRGSYGS
ncbi:glycosyltransferase [Acidithiobacillus ferrooxidans]|uniref:glycosyltransferase n=1 Tax=Acidithiobacillus ferrooxidans TaxID=920 RepID=UPI001C0724B0|nr:glycosyltransferase [Acidithiobacillus ferrooxidans]MBU2774312.1 glycosyltransferase [Acidithiobacillus ferrooxidans]